MSFADAAAGGPTALRGGELTLRARLATSSNNALLGDVRTDDGSVACVYKPVKGERPLWDFPDGTLARREVAAYLVSEAAGWRCVPPTVFRDGPFGPGMVQRWIDDADPDRVIDLFADGNVPDGWRAVFRGEDEAGRPLVVAHADTVELATVALFDVVTNNADRKGLHLLARPDGAVLGVDHGLTFHTEPKLRTVLWGWAGSPVPKVAAAGLGRLAAELAGPLAAELADYLDAVEIDALRSRVETLVRRPEFPLPPTDRTAIPWPPL